MVQSPETSFLAAPTTTQRKRRRDDHFPEPVSTPWGFIPEHRPLLHLPSKFTATLPPSPKLAKSTPPRTTPRQQQSLPRSSPKLKRLRASPTTAQEDEDYQMALSTSFDAAAPRKGVPERCHVCSRVQSLVVPSFGTVTVCAVCAEGTCYVCTRKCDGCDETVCSRCAEEKEVHSFCKRCMGAWKESRGRGGEGGGENDVRGIHDMKNYTE